MLDARVGIPRECVGRVSAHQSVIGGGRLCSQLSASGEAWGGAAGREPWPSPPDVWSPGYPPVRRRAPRHPSHQHRSHQHPSHQQRAHWYRTRWHLAGRPAPKLRPSMSVRPRAPTAVSPWTCPPAGRCTTSSSRRRPAYGSTGVPSISVHLERTSAAQPRRSVVRTHSSSSPPRRTCPRSRPR